MVRLLCAQWKRTLSFLLAVLLLATTAGAIGNYFVSRKKSITIGVAITNYDTGFMMNMALGMLEAALQQTQMLEVTMAGPAEAQELLQEGKAAVQIVLPTNFLEQVMNGKNEPVTVYYNTAMPLYAGIIRLFLNRILTLLQKSQMGIYSALDYTQTHAPQQYEQVFEEINRTYLNMVFAHHTAVKVVEVPVSGAPDLFTHYFFAAYFLLLTLGCNLYGDILQLVVGGRAVVTQKYMGNRSLRIAFVPVLGFALFLLLLSVLFFAGYMVAVSLLQLPVSMGFWLALPVVVVVLSVWYLLWFAIIPHATVRLVVMLFYAFFSFILSGGLLPAHFLPDILRQIAYFMPNYWLLGLLEYSATGQVSFLVCFVLLLCLLLCSAGLLLKIKNVGQTNVKFA